MQFVNSPVQKAHSSGSQNGMHKVKPKYTDDAQSICLRCEGGGGGGHVARQCPAPRSSKSQSTATTGSAEQGNGASPLL